MTTLVPVLTPHGDLLVEPVEADECAWLKAMVDSGEIFHPLRWTPDEAYQLLTDLPRARSGGRHCTGNLKPRGLLGTSTEFARFTKRLAARPQNTYGPLRDLVRPYILRCLKTDRSIIADLPDKTEVKAFCPLSRKQAVLYQRSVTELAAELAAPDAIRRRGVVLAFLMRFKQICNHPSQGETDVKKRQALVRRFQEDERVPFFVLSLKAGGAG